MGNAMTLERLQVVMEANTKKFNEEIIEQELDYYKAKMDDFAFWYNARLKKKKGGGSNG